MKSVEECLATALNLEQRASTANSDTSREMLLKAASEWRKLAEETVEAPRTTSRPAG